MKSYSQVKSVTTNKDNQIPLFLPKCKATLSPTSIQEIIDCHIRQNYCDWVIKKAKHKYRMNSIRCKRQK